MIISLNWIKKFVKVEMPVDELSSLIGSRLVEIEEIISLGEKYSDVLVARVVECNKLEGSDHLSLTKIDDGGKAKTVERDENGLVQVVCGAPNIAAGQLVAWLPPESTVPVTFGTNEPFVLGKRELRGFMSNGMIASAKELDLFDDHDGILVLDKELEPGSSFAEAYELNDYLFDIENKSLTHRPDCFGIIGFAREIAAITGQRFHTPDWLMNLEPDFAAVQSDEVDLVVAIDNAELSARYQAVVMSGAEKGKKSPLQVQTYLSRVGVRPINAVVDVTNYLMMLTGQPLHAFDYDKVLSINGKVDIRVRSGLDNEKLELLDGKTITLTPEDIVISNGETAIGLAGAMGGANSEIDENTQRIIIEAASFNLYNLRATQMRHGIFSEAITRFTKGQPASLTAPVLFDAVRLLGEWSGGQVISKFADAYPEKQKQISISTSVAEINDILGTKFEEDVITNVLENAEFVVEKSNELMIRVPYWRSDIHSVEDISEEVGRLTGFDNIKSVLPIREYKSSRPNDFDSFRTRLRKLLVRAGANEVLTYSFVHGNVIQKAGQDLNNSYAILNSISPDLQYYRQSLTPSLLDIVHPNIKQGFDKFALFELNKAQSKSDGLNEEGVPVESDNLGLVVASKNSENVAQYYLAKHILDFVCKSININPVYETVNSEMTDVIGLPFEYRRSARIFDKNSGAELGVIGEYKKMVAKGSKLPDAAGFEIDCRKLFEVYQKSNNHFTPISRYPSAERDICFQVDGSVNYSQVVDAASMSLDKTGLEFEITPVDIYQSEGSQTKNITIRLKFTSYQHTLEGKEVAELVNAVSASVINTVNATVI